MIDHQLDPRNKIVLENADVAPYLNGSDPLSDSFGAKIYVAIIDDYRYHLIHCETG